ncbi:MAG: helix-turn-helix transcriptional regulator [Bacteroidales bacterium]|nr:helix-turn-helix transcriptional regulator [Bacteroidales bacterium]
MNYQTFEPDENLRTFVKCYWILENPEETYPEVQEIVPDGCMEMIFHCADLYEQYDENGTSIIQPRCFVIGQLTRPLKIKPTGETKIFSVRFHPEGFMPFATIPIKEMENRAVSLKELFGKDGYEIEQKIVKSGSVFDKIKHIEEFLINKLSRTETIDRMIKSTVETILTANGQISVEDLTRQIDTNRRQLERKFSSAIGLSPKQLSKIVRLQMVLKLLMSGKFTNFIDLAHYGEYYDQAHFIKDFKEFTGYTPKEFYGKNLRMSFIFYGMD